MPAVDVDVDVTAIFLMDFGAAEDGVECEFFLVVFGDKAALFVGQGAGPEAEDALDEGGGGEVEAEFFFQEEFEGDVWMGGCFFGEYAAATAGFKPGAFEELFSGGHVVEQVFDGDGGTGRGGMGFEISEFATVYAEAVCGRGGRGAGDFHAGATGEAGEGFPPEAEGLEDVEVFQFADFAGGMALPAEFQIVAGHAATVISDADFIKSTFVELQDDFRGTGVDGVVQ